MRAILLLTILLFSTAVHAEDGHPSKEQYDAMLARSEWDQCLTTRATTLGASLCFPQSEIVPGVLGFCLRQQHRMEEVYSQGQLASDAAEIARAVHDEELIVSSVILTNQMQIRCTQELKP